MSQSAAESGLSQWLTSAAARSCGKPIDWPEAETSPNPAASEWLKSPIVREGLRKVCDLARAERREEKVALKLNPSPRCFVAANPTFMCGRVAQAKNPVEYGSMLKIDFTRGIPNAPPHYNGAPGQDYLIARAHPRHTTSRST